MKANAPKRKVFQDALDLLAENQVKDTPVPVNGIVSIPVEEIHPFHDHPFRLYEGDRLEDMVQSIMDCFNEQMKIADRVEIAVGYTSNSVKF